MPTRLPSRTAEQNATEFGALTKQGKDVRLALLVACSVEKSTRGGNKDRGPNGNRSLKILAGAFAEAADTSAERVLRHLAAWNKFAELTGLPAAADLTPSDAVRVDITPEQARVFVEDIDLDSKNGGTGTQKAKDIASNTTAMAEAIKANPKVAEAATQALIDKGDVGALSQATAKAAKNRQVERNRQRREEGLPKGRTVQDPKPQLGENLPSGEQAGLNAFFSVQGLAQALRALVTTFPREWAALSDAAREDEDFKGVCEETLDKIDIASAACRALVAGGVTDAQLQAILDGGE